MACVNLIGWDNGGGLSRDIEVLERCLRDAGHQVRFEGFTARRRQGIVPYRLRDVRAVAAHRLRHGRGAAYDVNLFLERLAPRYLTHARINCLIPNPEWFPERHRAYLGHVDVVLCKTHHAQSIFDALGCRTRYIGFTSLDRYDPGIVRRDDRACLHIAGRSGLKGTDALLALWTRHPEWPPLTVVQDTRHYVGWRTRQPVRAGNIHYRLGFLSDDAVRACQNTFPIHLCPSEVEGFGHVIAEAMSCGAVTLTTDAPPMHELVTPERGRLVRITRSRPHRLGTCFHVDPVDLERQLEAIFAMSHDEQARLVRQARRWYEDNDRSFRQRFRRFLDDVLS